MSLLFLLRPFREMVKVFTYPVVGGKQTKKVYKVRYTPEAVADPIDLSALRAEMKSHRKAVRKRRDEEDLITLLYAMDL